MLPAPGCVFSRVAGSVLCLGTAGVGCLLVEGVVRAGVVPQVGARGQRLMVLVVMAHLDVLLAFTFFSILPSALYPVTVQNH